MRSNETIDWSIGISKRATRVLGKVIKRRLGTGAIGKLEGALGQPDGWWQMQKKLKRGMAFSDLIAVLKAIGVSLQEFEAELFADEEEALESEEPDSALASPPVLGMIGTGVEDVARNWQEFLHQLDDLRYSNPFESLKNLTDCSASVPAVHVAGALAVVPRSHS